MEQKPHGDPDFDPEHNKRVIAEVNAANDELDKKKDRDHSSDVRERSNAAVSYLQNVSQGKGVTDVDKYFGKRYLAHLRGEEIVKKLKMNPAILKKMRNKMAKKGVLQPL